MSRLLLPMRLLLGLYLVLSGISHFFFPLWATPAGTQPLAMQLMSATANSGLLDVVVGIQMACGALILAGLFVPLALCLAMPIAVCGAFWAAVLERDPLWGAIALGVMAVNGALCLAHLGSYSPMLKRRALSLGESEAHNFDAHFFDPRGATSRRHFVAAVLTLAAAIIFYHYQVFGPYKIMGYIVMAYPTTVLIARRLNDMGWPDWLAIAPAAAAGFYLYPRMIDPTPYFGPPPAIAEVDWASLTVMGLAVVWGAFGKEKSAIT